MNKWISDLKWAPHNTLGCPVAAVFYLCGLETAGNKAHKALQPSRTGRLDEGHPMQGWAENVKWVPHFAVGHPVLGIASLVGLRRLGLWVHDVTCPDRKEARK